MRKYAVLKKPVRCNGGEIIYKIMLHTTKDGIYLYKYDAPDALECDDFYEDLDGTCIRGGGSNPGRGGRD